MHAKLLIVDMDNTLCDTFHTLSKNQWEGAAKALRNEGWPDKADQLLKMLGKSSFVHTMQRLEFTERQRAVAMRNYDKVPVNKLKLFDDAPALMDIPIPKVLVTRGE